MHTYGLSLLFVGAEEVKRCTGDCSTDACTEEHTLSSGLLAALLGRLLLLRRGDVPSGEQVVLDPEQPVERPGQVSLGLLVHVVCLGDDFNDGILHERQQRIHVHIVDDEGLASGLVCVDLAHKVQILDKVLVVVARYEFDQIPVEHVHSELGLFGCEFQVVSLQHELLALVAVHACGEVVLGDVEGEELHIDGFHNVLDEWCEQVGALGLDELNVLVAEADEFAHVLEAVHEVRFETCGVNVLRLGCCQCGVGHCCWSVVVVIIRR